jgi:hypothetical protein
MTASQTDGVALQSSRASIIVPEVAHADEETADNSRVAEWEAVPVSELMMIEV